MLKSCFWEFLNTEKEEKNGFQKSKKPAEFKKFFGEIKKSLTKKRRKFYERQKRRENLDR